MRNFIEWACLSRLSWHTKGKIMALLLGTPAFSISPLWIDYSYCLIKTVPFLSHRIKAVKMSGPKSQEEVSRGVQSILIRLIKQYIWIYVIHVEDNVKIYT
jgi:hypothetical protein